MVWIVISLNSIQTAVKQIATIRFYLNNGHPDYEKESLVISSRTYTTQVCIAILTLSLINNVYKSEK